MGEGGEGRRSKVVLAHGSAQFQQAGQPLDTAGAHCHDSRDTVAPSCSRRVDCCHGCGLYDGP
jgi:hypothetical protein